MASDLVLLNELLHIYGKKHSPLKSKEKFDLVVREVKLHPASNEEMEFAARFLQLNFEDFKDVKSHKSIH